MAELIVNLLQVIDVEHQQRTRHAITPPSFDLTRERYTKPTTVRETRQRIEVRIRTQSIDFLPQRHQLLRSFEQKIKLQRQLEIIKRAFEHSIVAHLDCGPLRTREHERNAFV